MWVHMLAYTASGDNGIENGVARIESTKEALSWADANREIPGFITARRLGKEWIPNPIVQREFMSNRNVTAFMRDNGLEDKDTRREFALEALQGGFRSWTNESTCYALEHDGEKYIVRFSEG